MLTEDDTHASRLLRLVGALAAHAARYGHRAPELLLTPATVGWLAPTSSWISLTIKGGRRSNQALIRRPSTSIVVPSHSPITGTSL